MNSLNTEAFTLFGQHILWSDMIGNILGLITLALGWRRSLWTWPVSCRVSPTWTVGEPASSVTVVSTGLMGPYSSQEAVVVSGTGSEAQTTAWYQSAVEVGMGNVHCPAASVSPSSKKGDWNPP